MVELLLIRDTFTENTTLGKLFANGTDFCHTLGDTVRAEGIKVYGHTAIPAGEYRVKLSKSSRFNRVMPMVYTEDNGYELKNGGISFKGIRMHGGNTHRNTEGCILVGEKFGDVRGQSGIQQSKPAMIKFRKMVREKLYDVGKISIVSIKC